VSAEQVELRAERLRVALRVLEAADDFDAGKYPEPAPVVGQDDAALFRTVSVEDRLLAQTCLDAERDLRRREWGAVEALLGALPPGGGIEDIYDLPAEQALPALRAAQVCGWLREAGA
jgi:hypothetical protein